MWCCGPAGAQSAKSKQQGAVAGIRNGGFVVVVVVEVVNIRGRAEQKQGSDSQQATLASHRTAEFDSADAATSTREVEWRRRVEPRWTLMVKVPTRTFACQKPDLR